VLLLSEKTKPTIKQIVVTAPQTQQLRTHTHSMKDVMKIISAQNEFPWLVCKSWHGKHDNSYKQYIVS
jgi:hypothetical protein